MIFFRSQTRFGVDFCCLGALPDAPGGCFWGPGALFETLRALLGCTEDAPRRSRDALGTLWAATGRPKKVPGVILNRFWVPQGVSRDRFSFDFLLIFAEIPEVQEIPEILDIPKILDIPDNPKIAENPENLKILMLIVLALLEIS